MFCTQEDVLAWTGYQVTGQTVIQAQSIVESMIGKVEEDVNDPRDFDLIGKAVAYQAAYMKDNYAKVFQQVSLAQVTQNGGIMTFKSGDKLSPFIAPLAVIACEGLSWKKSRSVRTGRILSRYGRWVAR